jgi:hypothetical protein
MRIEVDASEWSRAHGGTPRGRGCWAFDIAGEIVWFTGTYSAARKLALIAARADNVALVKVLS